MNSQGHLIERLTFEVETDKGENDLDTFNLFKTFFYSVLENHLEKLLDQHDTEKLHFIDKIEIDLGIINLLETSKFSDVEISTILKKINQSFSSQINNEIRPVKKDSVFINVFLDLLKNGYSKRAYLLGGKSISFYYSSISADDYKRLIQYIRVNRLDSIVSKRLINYLSSKQFSKIVIELFPNQYNAVAKVLLMIQNLKNSINDLNIIELENELNLLLLTLPLSKSVTEEELVKALVLNSSSLSSLIQNLFENNSDVIESDTGSNNELNYLLEPSMFSSEKFESRIHSIQHKDFFRALNYYVKNGSFNQTWFEFSNEEHHRLFISFLKSNSFLFREFLLKLRDDELSRLISISSINGSIDFLSTLIPNYNYQKKAFADAITKVEAFGLISFEQDLLFLFDRSVLSKFMQSKTSRILIDDKFLSDFFKGASYSFNLRAENLVIRDKYVENILNLINEIDSVNEPLKVENIRIDLDVDFIKNVLSYVLMRNKLPWWAERQLKLYSQHNQFNIDEDVLSFSVRFFKELRDISNADFEDFIIVMLNNKVTSDRLFYSNNEELKHLILGQVLPSFYSMSVTSFMIELNKLLNRFLPLKFHTESLFNNVCSSVIPNLKGSSYKTPDKLFVLLLESYSYALKTPYNTIFDIIVNNKIEFRNQLGLSKDQFELLIENISSFARVNSILAEPRIDSVTISELNESLITRQEYIDAIKVFIESGYFSALSRIRYADFSQIMNSLKKSNKSEADVLNVFKRSKEIHHLLNAIDRKNNENSSYKSLFIALSKDQQNISFNIVIEDYLKELYSQINMAPLESEILIDFIRRFEIYRKENISNQKLFDEQIKKGRISLFKEILSFLISPNLQIYDTKFEKKGVQLPSIQKLQDRVLLEQNVLKHLERFNEVILDQENKIETVHDLNKVFLEFSDKELLKDDNVSKVVDTLIELIIDSKFIETINTDLIERVGHQIDLIEEDIIKEGIKGFKESKDVLISTIEFYLHFAELPWWTPFSSNQELMFYFNKLFKNNQRYITDRFKIIIENSSVNIALSNYLNSTKDINIIQEKSNTLETHFRSLIDIELKGIPSDFNLVIINWFTDRLINLYQFELSRDLLQKINTAVLQFTRNEFKLDLSRSVGYYRGYYNIEVIDSINDFKLLTENSISMIQNVSVFDSEKERLIKTKVFSFVNAIDLKDSESFNRAADNLINFSPNYLQSYDEIQLILNGVSYLISILENKSFSDFMLSLRRKKSVLNSDSFEYVLESGKSERISKNMKEHPDFFIMIELMSLSSEDSFLSELFNFNRVIPYANALIEVGENGWGRSLLFLMLEAQCSVSNRSLYDTVNDLNTYIENKGPVLYPLLKEVLRDFYSESQYTGNSYMDVFNRLLVNTDESLKSNPEGILLKELIKSLQNDIGFLDGYTETFDFIENKSKSTLSFENEKLVEWSNIDSGERIYIPNAGVVLLWPFLTTLFRNLGYLDGKLFKDRKYQERAVHLIQYIVDGEDTAPEFVLMLNKIICGIELTDSIDLNIRLTEKEKDEVNSFIVTVKNQWKEMQNTSIDIFRDTFLKREGALMFEKGKWNLKVEHKAIDILLTKLPWGLSMVKYSWNEYLIIVEWDAKN